jgi:hypothetical protein
MSEKTKTFVESVAEALDAAGVPPVKTVEDPRADAGFRNEATGYHVHGGRRFATVAILARDGIPQAARQAERDGILQAAHHALAQAGYTVTINEYGTLRVTEGT